MLVVTGLGPQGQQGDFATARSEQIHQFGQSQHNLGTELLVSVVKDPRKYLGCGLLAQSAA